MDKTKVNVMLSMLSMSRYHNGSILILIIYGTGFAKTVPICTRTEIHYNDTLMHTPKASSTWL